MLPARGRSTSDPMKRFIPFMKQDPVVAVLRLQGMIASGGRGAARNDAGLAPMIEKAFRKGKPAAIEVPPGEARAVPLSVLAGRPGAGWGPAPCRRVPPASSLGSSRSRLLSSARGPFRASVSQVSVPDGDPLG